MGSLFCNRNYSTEVIKEGKYYKATGESKTPTAVQVSSRIDNLTQSKQVPASQRVSWISHVFSNNIQSL